MYEIDRYTVLHSGRDLPGLGDALQRGEGVAIVLDPVLSVAWRDAGEVWTAVNSRFVSARLRLCLGGSGCTSSKLNVTVVSVYAPTHGAPSEVKERFYDDLQAVIDSVPSSDVLLTMGDFNARVGGGGDSSSLWSGVHGPFGVGWLNESGETLLSFCALNQLCIMNTMFQKKRIHQYTWQHPGTKLWHCIHYVLLRQSQRLCCTDVTVFCSAQCWMDHKLLCATLKYAPVVKQRSFLSKGRRRFNVAPLADSSFASRFTDHVVHLVNSNWCAAVDGLAKWTAIKESLLEAGGEMLGWSSRKHPD